MHWLKRTPWRTGITIAGMLLLLMFMAWISAVVARAHEGGSGFTEPVKVTELATPTEDATVATLNEEKLVQEVK